MFASMRRSQKNEGNMARIQGEIGKASWWQQNRRIEREGSSAEGVEKQKAFTTQMWYQGVWFFFFFFAWKRSNWASDSAERGQYEDAEKSKDGLRDWNGRWSIANKSVYVHQIEMENSVHSVCWMFTAFGNAHRKGGQVTWLKLQAIKTSKDFSCFKEQQVVSLFSVSFILP